MEITDVKKNNLTEEPEESLKGTLFSTIVFVGGGIVFFIILLFVIYMTRL